MRILFCTGNRGKLKEVKALFAGLGHEVEQLDEDCPEIQADTLEEVVEHYDRGGDVQDNLSPEMKPLDLTAQEKADLVEFMKSLTGKPMQVVVPQLPNY